MAFYNYQAKKFSSTKTIMVNDNLTVEQPLQICINNEPFTVTMRTPGNDNHLINGLLYSEDIYRNTKHHLNITFKEEEKTTIANINVDENLLGKGYLNSRNFLSVSSCGICGKKELNELVQHQERIPKYTISHATINSMFEQMKKGQLTFLQSGGSHAAAAFNIKAELLSLMEDIGRHNAVDKVIGDLIISNNIKQVGCMVVSGRISYEIVIKAFAAKIGILAAVSAPSTLAVDFAKELGITLLGFCRNDNATCYSHPERIG